jgi:HlyD family secretion protein
MTQVRSATHSRRQHERVAAVASLIFAAVLLAAIFIVRISGGISAPGQMLADGENIVLQHPDGGRVRSVHVANGDTVTKGAPLLDLESEELDAELARLKRQRLELDIRLARLKAAVDGSASLPVSGLRGRDGAEPEAGAILKTQAEALKAERAALAAEVNRAARRAEGAESARTVLRGQIAANQDRARLIESEIADLSDLVNEQLVSRSRLTALQREALEIRQRLEALNLEDTRLANEAAAARLDQTSLQRRDTDRLWQDIEDAELKRADYDRQITALSARLARTKIIAPGDGRIHELAVRQPGGVIEPGGLIVKIVPQNGGGLARVRINPVDIDEVKAGQSARLRFDTFEFSGAPELRGTVASVAPDRSIDPLTGESFYEVRIVVAAPEKTRLAALSPGAGAPVTALIETRQRSLATYLLEPALRAFKRLFEAD